MVDFPTKIGRLAMQRQIHKRLPKDFVKDLLKTFCAGEIAREQVCELLGLSRA